MKPLTKSSVSLNVRRVDVKYSIFHTPGLDLDHMVIRWIKETEDYTNVSLVEFIKSNSPETLAFTKREARQLNIKKTL